MENKSTEIKETILENKDIKYKILFISNPCGNFEQVKDFYYRIPQEKRAFDYIILIGNVFSPSENFNQLKNELSLLSPEIIIFDNSEVNTILKSKIGNDIYKYTSNITILGRSGIYTPKDTNLNIVYLNGLEATKEKTLDYNEAIYTGNYYNINDVQYILDKNINKCDILLINTMPQIFYHKLLSNFSSPLNKDDIAINKNHYESLKISFITNLLINTINPRYILSSTEDFFYEQTPYINTNNYLSRFIHLGYLNNKTNKSEKYFFAIGIKPITNTTKNELDDLDDINNIKYMENPFTSIPLTINSALDFKDKFGCEDITIIKDELCLTNVHRHLIYEDIKEFLLQFGEPIKIDMVYDNKRRFTGTVYVKFSDIQAHNELLKKNDFYQLKGRTIHIKEKTIKALTSEDIAKQCWFCYNNPQIDKHLLLKVFNNFYLAYPKGPIQDFHFMILPKKHLQSYLEFDSCIKNEYKNIVDSIINFIKLHDLEYFIYEKNLNYNFVTQRHMITHIIGVDNNTMIAYSNQAAAFIESKGLKYNMSYDNNYLDRINHKCFYHYINGNIGINIGKKEKRLIYFIEVDKDSKDYNDYSRILICELNQCLDRVNWRNSSINEEFLNILKTKINSYYT